MQEAKRVHCREKIKCLLMDMNASEIQNWSSKTEQKTFFFFFLLNASKHFYHKDFATQDRHLCVYYITFLHQNI